MVAPRSALPILSVSGMSAVSVGGSAVKRSVLRHTRKDGATLPVLDAMVPTVITVETSPFGKRTIGVEP